MGRCKKGHKSPKQKPYGATRGKYWCWGCDAALVPSWTKPIKKKARREAKLAIKKELE